MATAIYGKMCQPDLENNQNSLDWYRLHGFDIKPPSLNNKLKRSSFNLSRYCISLT